jgi:DNA (cytosine-5)-methyltransferase 1
VSDYTALCIGNGQLNQMSMAEQANTLDCMHDQQAVLTDGKPPRKYIVRRLTPLECCRLQGFPDWWEDGVEGSDTARYKMWGNGIALPCAADVLRRIAKEVRGDGQTNSF